METLKTLKGYELHERIGSGGFGVVYRAYQSTVGREVAIKIILPHYANHPDFIRRFETEAQLIARLEHPYIVPLYDYWRDPEGAYLVMRWLRGGSLRELLARGPLEPDAASCLLDQVAAALDLAHRHQVVHRDLKPANVLLDEDGNGYLSDFGIAKDVGDPQRGLTGTGMIIGSPDYLAPEQARSDPVTPQTDIYSLGVMLYEMLAGAHPFPDKTPVERMYQHLNAPLPPITTLPDDLCDDLNAIIQKATAKNPAHRYDSTLEMAGAIRNVLSVTQTSTSLVEQLTLREQEILQLIAEGCSNQDIAQRLFVTVATVKWHVWQLYRKLRVRSRVQAIARAREMDLMLPAAAIPAADLTEATPIDLPAPENPYKGLRAFQAADARDFFGREKLVGRLVKCLGDPKQGRFLAVVGPSGSGKSSVVRAGVIPALWRGEVPGSDRWFIVEMIPGARPLDELEVALTRIAATYADNLHEHLERDENGLLRVAGLILPNDGSELLIVVDQFEEVFTLVEDESRRAHFLDLLHAAVTDPRSRVRLIITLRADFYDRPLNYARFGELVRAHMETVLPLSAEELEAAVVQPAARVGVSFEPGLVATIISESHYQPGALPLLQYALTELFEQRDGRTLTQAAYQVLGGAVGALARRADELYLEQSPEGREAIRQMFLRLVALGEEAEDTRRRVPRSELLAVTAGEDDLMDEVIDTYAAYRLLTLDHDPATRSPTVEMAHEAILREWERLHGWLETSRLDIRQQRLLAVAAADWHKANQDPSYLLRGARLDQFGAWATATPIALTTRERAFLDASLAQQSHETESERERQQKELELARRAAASQRRAANRLRVMVAGLVVFLVGTLALALFAFGQRNEARKAKRASDREAQVNHSLVIAGKAETEYESGKTDLALALAMESVNMTDPPAESRQTLTQLAFSPGTRRLLPMHQDWVYSLAFSPDGQMVASGSCAGEWSEDFEYCPQGELWLWRAESGEVVRKFPVGEGAICSVAFSPDGRQLLSGSGSCNVYSLSDRDRTGEADMVLWDVETGEALLTFTGHSRWVYSVAFSPDGTLIASGAGDGVLRLWNAHTGELLQQFDDNPGPVHHVAFSPDGSRLYSVSGNVIAVRDVADGQEIYRLEQTTNQVLSLAVNSNGQTFLAGMEGGTIVLCDAETGTEIDRAFLNTAVEYIAISPDGQTALLSNQSHVFLWDLPGWQAIFNTLQDEYTGSGAVAISPDGLTGIYAPYQHIHLLNLKSPGQLRQLADGGPYAVALTPDGTRLITGSVHGVVAVWDRTSGEVIHEMPGNAGQVTAIAVSPDGRLALVTGWDYLSGTNATSVILWNLETGELVRRFEVSRLYARAAAFAPDGTTALVGTFSWGPAAEGTGGELILFDTTSGEVIRAFALEDVGVTDIAFSADGTQALTGSAYPTRATLWDVATGQPLRHFEGHTETLYDVAFGPGEQTVLGASGDSTVIVWNRDSGEIVRRLQGHGNEVWGMDVSSDGQHVITASLDGTIRLWDFTSGLLLRVFDNHGSAAYKVVFSTDGQRAYSTGGGMGPFIEWDVSTPTLAELIAWVHENRYVRDFTCDERAQYRIEPLCE